MPDAAKTSKTPKTGRVRPTREETRANLLDAAAQVFAEKGIGATSIEEICAAGGYTRGAFYSSFPSKDDLVIELLEAHLESNWVEANRLYENSANAVEFIEAMNSEDRRPTLPVDNAGLLYMELTMYALRNRENQPRLLEQHRRQGELMRAMLTQMSADEGLEIPGGVDDAAELLQAFDTGLLFHAVIDPESHDPDQWVRTVVNLHGIWSKVAQ